MTRKTKKNIPCFHFLSYCTSNIRYLTALFNFYYGFYENFWRVSSALTGKTRVARLGRQSAATRVLANAHPPTGGGKVQFMQVKWLRAAGAAGAAEAAAQ